MRLPLLIIAAAATLARAADPGLPARSSPADYPANAAGSSATVAAEIMDPEQVRHRFATDLSNYVVMEVAVYPKDGRRIDLHAMDFALQMDDRPYVRPVDPKRIAGVVQRKSRSRADDILLYPSVGVTTGTWGTGTTVGVGVGVGGGPPGPASTDADRRTMQLELEEQGLPDRTIVKPVAGYLYFPVGNKKYDKFELRYEGESPEVILPLTMPASK
jgi:hypothetical protein